jgi:site-specific recombinase XerD
MYILFLLVLFTNQIKNILLKHKAKQEDNRKIFGDCYINNDYVCTWKDGKPISPNYLTRTFDKIIKESSLPKIRLHDLRHSTASNLLANGISVVEVQHFLGHSQPSTTLNFYSHVDSSSKKNISNFLEKTLLF